MGRDVEKIATEIVDGAVQLHRRVGPGLLESVYRRLLEKELERRGVPVRREVKVGFELDGLVFRKGLRLDLLVDERVVVEVKSVERLPPVAWKQLLTYLRALDLRLGILLNFGGATLKEGGIHRVVNRYRPPPTSPLRINRQPPQEGGSARRPDQRMSPLQEVRIEKRRAR